MSTGNPSQNLPLPYGQTGEWSGITESGAGKFPNPFFDIASEYVPRNLLQIFEWAEYLYLTYGTYRSAARKVVRYFLTELVFEGESDTDREKAEDFYNNEMHLLSRLAEIGDDFMVYGNDFISIFFPFDRFLICPQCRMRFHISTMDYRFDLPHLAFTAKCGKCNYDGPFKREDVRSPDTKRVKIIRWNPKRIRLRVHLISGKVQYFMELEPRFVQRIREGRHFFLNDSPWPLIECCARAGDEIPLFQFEDDSIYHMREATLAGFPLMRGWGIPPILPNFKLAYYIQVLRRYDEAIALDFIVPFRVMFPSQQAPAAGMDPLQMMSMDVFLAHLGGMVEAKRKNITDIQIAPFSIGYEMLGGEAQTLAPKDNIAQAMDELLNAVGFPAELYRGSLSIQAFPVALRLFEKTWGTLVDGYNDLIQWITKRINQYFGWGEIDVSLRSVTLADDIERKALMLQAAAGMDISKGTAYRPVGVDFLEEQRKVVEEQKEIMQLQQEAMEEQEAAQMQGQGGGQADPGVGATPGDVNQQAKDLAYQLVTQTPETMRRGELIKIKQSNPTLHALVLQEMNNLRQELSRQGQAMMLQQAQQQPGMKIAADDASQLPSPLRLALEIATQVCDYTRSDLRKLAWAIKRDIPDTTKIASIKTAPPSLRAFRFIFRRAVGWE